MKYPHWQYYLSLVEDVDRASRYVELAKANYETYSTEFTRLLLATGSEIDVVAKLLCKSIDSSSKPENIVECGQILLSSHPGLTSVEVTIPRCGLNFVPWRDWTNDERPCWWSSYNRVKHERNTYFSEADLGNVLRAVAGLCVLVCYLYYNDFIAKGLATRQPFFYLDAKYNAGGAILFAPKTQLPDFSSESEDD